MDILYQGKVHKIIFGYEYMQVIINGQNPKLGFFSGIHGDEWRVISSVRKVIDAYKTKLGSFVFIPELSPSAVKLRTRKNAERIDLNRSFTQNPQSKEAKKIISILQPYTFELCVDFHEDTELSGVYLYDSIDVEGSEVLASFRNQVKRVAPLFSGVDDKTDKQLGRRANQGYRVSLPPEKDENGNYTYEGFFDFWALIEGKTKRWMTLEVPTNLTELQKDKIVDIFFRTFILGNAIL